MTKNVGIDLAIKHMRAMGIWCAEGRSGAAAKLHMLEHRDTWKIEKHGTNLNMVKVHGISRKEWYTPSGEEEYPVDNGDLEAVRVTAGVTESNKVFEIEDKWKRPGRSSRVVSESWTGQTYFTVKASARKKVNYEINAAPTQSAYRR